MMIHPPLWPLLAALSLGQAAAETRFEPARCFPIECMAYLEVRSGKGLVEALAETLPGRIALDREVRAALGRVPEMARAELRRAAAPMIEATGRDPLELLTLLEGEVSVSVTGIDPLAKLSVLAAFELGPRRAAILEVVDRISAHLARGRGAPPAPLEIAGKKVGVWALAPGAPPIHHVVLGTHLLLATSPDPLREAIEAFGEPPGPRSFSLGANPRYLEAEEGLRLENPRLRGFINLEAIRSLVMTFLARDPGAAELVKGLRSSGLLGVSILGLALGSGKDGFEVKLLLGTKAGERGLLGGLLASIEPPTDSPPPALLLPRATSLGAMGVHPGRLLGEVHRFMKSGLPERFYFLAEEIIRSLEERTGLSLEKDLLTLGRLDLTHFTVDPPAGGLLPDQLALVRTKGFEPCRSILLRIARALGKEPRAVEGPRVEGKGPLAIRFLTVGSPLSRLIGGEDLGALSPLTLVEPPLSLAWSDLEEGWTVLARSPQEVWRYLRSRIAGETGPPGGLAGRLKETGAGASFSMVRRSGGTLWAYNTVTALAVPLSSLLGEKLEALGLAPSLLPPGEKFLGSVKDGLLLIRTGQDGLLIHCRGSIWEEGLLWLSFFAGVGGAVALQG